MTQRTGGMGRSDFVARHGLRTGEQEAAAAELVKHVADRGVEVVRLSFPDQHGILRGKSLVVDELANAMRDGCTITTTLLAKDTAHRTVYPVFTKGGGFDIEAMTGGGDFVMVPDPETFRILPWAPDTGWMLCDIYFPDGAPVPFATREIFRAALSRLADRGYDYVAGLEVEFHLLKLEDPKLRPEHATQPGEPPEVSLVTQGFQYLTENRLDQLDPMLQILRRDLLALDLPLRTLEVEFGPSQCELTFAAGTGLAVAANMVLLRSAVKQICRRHGCHATFMCRPALPNLFSSGWHLHQSFRHRESGENAFIPANDGELLSPVGRQVVAGILAHARAASVFTTPTINGYKRFRPNSLAPDRAVWARDNRGAMLRVVGGPGDPGSRVENRIGEPAANSYLYMSSQILAGLDGIERELEPAAPVDAPYESDAEPLPQSLIEAVAALRDNAMFRAALGDMFVDYIVTLKEAEIARFLSEVTDWEQREYFDLF